MRIVDDYLERAFLDLRPFRPRVGIRADDPTLQVVFGRAFLLELRRGDVDRARLFARAFLVHCTPCRF